MWCSGKESTCQCRTRGYNPWVRKIPWRRTWQPTPVFLPEKSHGQRSLETYSPWSCKESDTTEWLSTLTVYSINMSGAPRIGIKLRLLVGACVIVGGGLVAKLCPTLATPWTIACQAPLSMGFSRQEYWNGLQKKEQSMCHQEVYML